VTAPAPVSYTVDPWDPGYGVAFSEELDGGALEESTAELNLDLETPSAQWRPVDPDPATVLPGTVLFAAGVRRIDARVWVHGTRPQPVPGIAASFAADIVSCDGAARITAVAVERGLFTAAAKAAGITAGRVSYPARLAAGPAFEQLSLALAAAARRRRGAAGPDLPSAEPGRRRPAGHRRAAARPHPSGSRRWLHQDPPRLLPAAGAGGRRLRAAAAAADPAFTMGTSWRRNSWYLQLPRTSGVPWSDVVRLECSADLPVAEVTRLGDLAARLLPPLASVPHKDPRAPQNLVPIGGLERELRHRLGDQHVLYRALRAAAMAPAKG
jgi:hypothetical protein